MSAFRYSAAAAALQVEETRQRASLTGQWFVGYRWLVTRVSVHAQEGLVGSCHHVQPGLDAGEWANEKEVAVPAHTKGKYFGAPCFTNDPVFCLLGAAHFFVTHIFPRVLSATARATAPSFHVPEGATKNKEQSQTRAPSTSKVPHILLLLSTFRMAEDETNRGPERRILSNVEHLTPKMMPNGPFPKEDGEVLAPVQPNFVFFFDTHLFEQTFTRPLQVAPSPVGDVFPG